MKSLILRWMKDAITFRVSAETVLFREVIDLQRLQMLTSELPLSACRVDVG